MRARLSLKNCVVGAALTLASLASPVLAGEKRPHDTHEGATSERRDPESADGYDFGRARADWLAECRRRTPAHDQDVRGPAPDSCEAYLDEFYARRGPPYGYAPYGPGQPMPEYAYGQAYGYGPMVMVPVPQSKPECTETIEYVYDDVPARRTIPRARPRTPDKRIRVAPDKRTRIN